MSNYDPNLTHALAILTTEVEERRIGFKAGSVIVRGQCLNPQNDDDRAVLAILMADKEFGFSVSTVENLAKELRELQKVWCDAADELELEAVA